MSKNVIIAILVILVGLMAVSLIVTEDRHKEAEKSLEQLDASSNSATVVTNTLSSVEPDVVERIPSKDDEPRHITSIFEATGKGTYAKWGVAADANIYYLVKLVATSKVESKEEPTPGKICVTEIRTFHEATEIVKPSKPNLRVDLSTLPIDQIESAGTLLGGLVYIFEPIEGLAIINEVKAFRDLLDTLDGQDTGPIMDFLCQFGIDVEKIINEPMENYLENLLVDVHAHVNAVQGNSYRFIYWTDREGEPLRVRYENVDHSPLSLEERNILNYVNLFIDCQVLPDKRCRPGQEWNIDPSAVASMFGVMTGGRCAGEVRVRRGNDLPDGNWDLTIHPAPIQLYSEDGRPIGNVKVNGGRAVGDARKVVLRELQIDGAGKLRKYDKETHFWFFDFGVKIEGDCEFRTTILPKIEE